MARYTLELRTLMDDVNIRPYLNKALSTYPMYTPLSDNAEVKAIIPTREVLNEKLLNHYKYREIGFESIERFLDELEIAMNEIMPYYNQLYKSQLFTAFEYSKAVRYDYLSVDDGGNLYLIVLALNYDGQVYFYLFHVSTLRFAGMVQISRSRAM